MNAQKLSDLINYQEDAIVSREILKQKNGNITLFAFDKNQGLSKHQAPFDAFLYILEGDAEITISEKVFKLKSGEEIIIPSQKPHSIKAKTRLKMLLIMILGKK